MLPRALAIWLILVVVAVLNAAFRTAVLTPRLGEQGGHVASTLTLCGLILLVAWAFIPWIDPHGARDAFLIGGVWLALTVAFEFLAGHYLFGSSWEKLLADYDLARGRVWMLVLVATFVAPVIALHLRQP